MTPSNPTNQQPLIYRIADALGITHLVVAVQHSHLMSEIEGLVSALAGKSDTSHTHKLIQYNPSASTDGFAGFTVSGAGSFTIGVLTDKSINFQFGPTVKASITNSNVDNLARALEDPDASPTANSDHLVTSGGVKAALDGKQDALTFDTTPTADSTNPVTSGGVATALDSKASKSLIDYTVSGIGRAFIQLGTDDETEIHVEIQVAKNGVTDNVDITVDNMPNLQRALQTPDTTPTANSNKLVKSGGVKAALDGKQDALTFDTTPTADSTNPVTSGGVKAALDGKAPKGDTEVIFEEGENLFVYLPYCFENGERQRSFILNYQGDPTELINLFGCSTHDMIRILSHDDSTIMVGECYIAVRVIKQPSGVEQGDVYYIIFDGRNDY